MLAIATISLLCGLANSASTSIPFKDNGKLIVIGVRVNASRPLRFTLDSGASSSVIDSAVARSLHLVPDGSHVGSGAGAGAIRFDVFRRLHLSMDGVNWLAAKAYGVSLQGTGTTVPEDGLIGSDLFAKYVVDVNYAMHTVTLCDPSKFRYDGRGIALPISFAHNRPFVSVTVKVAGQDPKQRIVLVDSGSEDALDDDIIARSTAPKRIVHSGVGLGKRFYAYYGPIQWARIGDYTIRNVQGVSGGVALIGQSVLRRFSRVTFDYARHRIYFTR